MSGNMKYAVGMSWEEGCAGTVGTRVQMGASTNQGQNIDPKIERSLI